MRNSFGDFMLEAVIPALFAALLAVTIGAFVADCLDDTPSADERAADALERIAADGECDCAGNSDE